MTKGQRSYACAHIHFPLPRQVGGWRINNVIKHIHGELCTQGWHQDSVETKLSRQIYSSYHCLFTNRPALLTHLPPSIWTRQPHPHTHTHTHCCIQVKDNRAPTEVQHITLATFIYEGCEDTHPTDLKFVVQSEQVPRSSQACSPKTVCHHLNVKLYNLFPSFKKKEDFLN